MNYSSLPPGRARRLAYDAQRRVMVSRQNEYYYEDVPDYVYEYEIKPKPTSFYNYIFNTSLNLDNNIFCCICQNSENFCILRKIKKCKHNFHSFCLDKYVLSFNTCPICRIGI